MKLLIVDDEQLTRDSLVKMVPWHALGITDIQTAADGFLALKAAESVPPDIVLCDVMMPRMDGMQFSRQLREFCPDCRIIFISGFANKEHLKEAITLRATRYIEKPILLDELKQAIRETVAQCRAMAENREEVNELRERQANILPLLRRQMAADLVQGSKTTHELQNEYGMLYHELSSAERYYVGYYRIRQPKSSGGPQAGELGDEAPLKDWLEEASVFFKARGEGETAILTAVQGRRDLAVFIRGDEMETERAMDAAGDFFAHLLAEKGADLITLSLCGPVESIAELHPCCRLARAAAAWQAFCAPETVNRLPFAEGDIYHPDTMAARALGKLLDAGHATGIHRFFREWSSKILEKQCGSVDAVRTNTDELLTVCIAMETRLSGMARDAKSIGALREGLMHCVTLSELTTRLDAFIDSLFPELALASHVSPKVQQAVAHIETHYQDKALSAQSIARALSVTTIYLCTIYKRETGKTIGQTIRGVRVQRAKRLLETDMKVYEVAGRVGYQDPNYFCTMFRRETGVSPAAYRKEALQAQGREARHD